jgi:hypothetical protein
MGAGGSRGSARYARHVAMPHLSAEEDAKRAQRVLECADQARVKQFGGGRQSAGVWLLSNGVVAKQLLPEDAAKFRTEVAHLHRLRDCPLVAHMVAYDPERLVIYTEYAGEPPAAYTPRLKGRVEAMMKHLKQKHGLAREFGNSGLPRLANLAVGREGALRLIDFGTPWWRP